MKRYEKSSLRALFAAFNGSALARACSFCTNLLQARFIEASAVGTTTVSFVLFETLSLTTLTLGFRVAALREVNDESKNEEEIATATEQASPPSKDVLLSLQQGEYQSNLNVAWIGTGLSIWISCFLGLLWVIVPARPCRYYELAVGFMVISSCLRALAEPLLVFVLLHGDLETRIKAETGAALAKSISMLFFVLIFSFLWGVGSAAVGVLSYGGSMVVFGVVYGAILYSRMKKLTASTSIFNVIPPLQPLPSSQPSQSPQSSHPSQSSQPSHRSLPPPSKKECMMQEPTGSVSEKVLTYNWLRKLLGKYLSPMHARIILPCGMLGAQKAAENELDRFVLLTFFESQLWPVMGIVLTLTGALTRLVFTPLEDIASVVFSRNCFNGKCSHSSRSNLLKDFGTYWSIGVLIGLAGLTVGAPLATAAMHLTCGPRWLLVGGHLLLKRYCVLLLLGAAVGVGEKLITATADSPWLWRLQKINACLALIGVASIATLKRLICSTSANLIESNVAQGNFIINVSCSLMILRLVVLLIYLGEPSTEGVSSDKVSSEGNFNQSWTYWIKETCRKVVNGLNILYGTIPPVARLVAVALIAAGILLRITLTMRNSMEKMVWDAAMATQDGTTVSLQQLSLKAAILEGLIGGSITAVCLAICFSVSLVFHECIHRKNLLVAKKTL